jgi:hypothetical protein
MGNPEEYKEKFQRRKPITRRDFLLKGTIMIGAFLGGEWLSCRLRRFFLEKDARLEMAKEIVSRFQFLLSGGGLQQTVIAINRLNNAAGVEESIPFDAFYENGGWFQLNREGVERYWQFFWNFSDPLPLGFLFDAFSSRNREEVSNKLFPSFFIYASKRLVEVLGGEKRLLSTLGVPFESLSFDKEKDLWVIDCSGGIFPYMGSNNTVFRLYPYTTMGIVAKENFRTLFPPKYNKEWLEEVDKEGVLVPLSSKRLTIDYWMTENTNEEILPLLPRGNLREIDDPFPLIPKITSPLITTKIQTPAIWSGFKQRIHPYQISEVSGELVQQIWEKERGSKIRVETRFPKISFFPFTFQEVNSFPVGVWKRTSLTFPV